MIPTTRPPATRTASAGGSCRSEIAFCRQLLTSHGRLYVQIRDRIGHRTAPSPAGLATTSLGRAGEEQVARLGSLSPGLFRAGLARRAPGGRGRRVPRRGHVPAGPLLGRARRGDARPRHRRDSRPLGAVERFARRASLIAQASRPFRVGRQRDLGRFGAGGHRRHVLSCPRHDPRSGQASSVLGHDGMLPPTRWGRWDFDCGRWWG